MPWHGIRTLPRIAMRSTGPWRVRAPRRHRVWFGAASLLAGLSCATHADVPEIHFVRHDIVSQNPGQLSEGFGVGDLDGDDRPDILEGGESALVWYRNPDWTAQPIATGFRYSAGAAIVVIDLDGDGRQDVITGRFPVDAPERREEVWFGNTAGGWVEHVLSPNTFCHGLAFGDLAGHGRPDAICTDQYRDEILLLEAPADPTSGAWTSHVLDSGRSPIRAAIADIDGDGRPDAVSGRGWYRNAGGGVWPRYAYTTLTNPADHRFDDHAEIAVLDIDGDGRLDILATLFADSLQGALYAFLAPPDPIHSPWEAVLIDPGPLWCVHSQAVASFDGIGRVQVMVGEPDAAGFNFGVNPSPRVRVYRLLGPARDPPSWQRTVVDTIGTIEATAVDIDGDGLPDIAGHEGGRNPGGPPARISWWQNTTQAPPTTGTTATTAAITTTTTTTLGGASPESPPCASLACLCPDVSMPACVGERVPGPIRRRIARACRLVASGARTARVRRVLKRTAGLAARAGRKGAISEPCAGAIGGLTPAAPRSSH